MQKYNSPFPGRKITGTDFKELVDYLNSVIEESYLTSEKLQQIRLEIETLNSDTDERVRSFKKELHTAQDLLIKINKKNKKLSKSIEGFYGRQIELFGIFIAIFSFIIAGIQMTTKVEGSFVEKL